MPGPLAGLRVVELAGLGPGPHASMILGDWGAEVIRVVRPGPDGAPNDINTDAMLRNRTLVAANMKSPEDVNGVLDLISQADVFIEGFRPGVTERMGVGPEVCLERNPGLIYARMTGWGQSGPRSMTAGHDINYLAITGMLDTIGEAEKPAVPLNLLGDFGGGSMYLVCAVLAALFERQQSGQGQVIDAAIVDGVGMVGQMIWAFRGMGMWKETRASNMLDGGAPYYGVYECSDGKHISVGAIEQPFYDQVLAGLGLERSDLPNRDDPAEWPALHNRLAEVFSTKTRDDWTAVFNGTDACVAPVLTMTEALAEEHNTTRGAFSSIAGVEQPVHASLFGRSVPDLPAAPGSRPATVAGVLGEWSKAPGA